MRTELGKTVYESLKEIVNPAHTAVIVVDVQNDYCEPEGYKGKVGKDLSEMKTLVRNLAEFLEKARDQGVFTVFIQNTTTQGGLSDSGAWVHHLTKNNLRRPGDLHIVEDTWGHEIVADLKRRPDEPVVRKHRPSAFHETVLDTVLRNRGVHSVIVTGLATSGCVLATALDACWHDYYVVVLRDCVAGGGGEQDKAALQLLSSHYLVHSSQVLAEWAKDPLAVQPVTV